MLLSSLVHPSPIPLYVAGDGDLSGLRLRSSAGLMRVRHGVYATIDEWANLKPWERYLARVHAYALVAPNVVFCLESAAALLGLPLFGEPRDIHIFDPSRKQSTRYGDVVVHSSVDERSLVQAPGMLLTSVVDTAVDLGRVLPPAFGLSVWDVAVRSSASPEAARKQLDELVDHRVDGRGMRKLRWLRERVDPVSESVGESVSRAVIGWLGFPAPVLQQCFSFEGEDDRTDFFWPHARIVGESDGFGKYEASTTAESARRLFKEKQREDRLRRYLRGLARWDWPVTMRGYPLGDRLHAAGLVAATSPNQAMLATLRRNPRSLA